MKRVIYCMGILLLTASTGVAQVAVTALLCESRKDPIGIDVAIPRFSWQLAADKRNVSQSAYEIKVTEGGTAVWTSGKVVSAQSLHIPYAGKALASGKRYQWRVRIWDNSGKPSPWSAAAFWQTALLAASDWKANWITPGFTEDEMRPSPLFRKQFKSAKAVKSAIVYITAHGLYEAHINGQRVGDAYLTPGWTSYNKRLQYQVYNVTELIKQGDNAIGVELGSGWYRGTLAWTNNNNIYGKDIALLLQLEITYNNGDKETIVSDGSWKSSVGAIKSAEIYNGETYDARAEKQGWTTGSYNDADWSGVKVVDSAKNTLIATCNEPVKKHETFRPVKVLTTPAGEQVIDFGQNLVGWVVVKARGQAGDKVTISHAEVLDKKGNFYTENLRAAKSQNNYILKGGGTETFEPHFTWHGFRYIKVEGVKGTINPDDFTAVALYSDMKPTGSLTTSNPLVNQLQHNIQWGQKGNFLDVPTDCPQRDERLGWTGDAQVFARTAAFNMNVHNFFAKWLKDVAADQTPQGEVPYVIPNVFHNNTGSTGWGEAATVIPWNMYLLYGDKRLLEQQYASMKGWVDFMKSKSQQDLYRPSVSFGDWLFYSINDDRSGQSAITDRHLIGQCFYAYSTQLLLNAAQALGNQKDLQEYSALLLRIKNAFVAEYVTSNGKLVSSTQTAYVLALQFDMLPEKIRQQAAERLVENIKSYNNHISTGFLGTPYICHVLSRFGHTDVAYKLLLQDTYPSWLYPVKMGATTIWERWDGIKTDSTFQTPTMNSFNHYAYGVIGDWMYRVMAGIETYGDEVAYHHSTIKPHPGGGFTRAAASLETYYGRLSSSWKKENGLFTLEVEIPANTTADIYIPLSGNSAVSEGDQPVAANKDIKVISTDSNYVQVQVGSGSYRFSVPVGSK
jgi:alpha-L-rhamnosidase